MSAGANLLGGVQTVLAVLAAFAREMNPGAAGVKLPMVWRRYFSTPPPAYDLLAGGGYPWQVSTKRWESP
jgi:hypothetical protein